MQEHFIHSRHSKHTFEWHILASNLHTEWLQTSAFHWGKKSALSTVLSRGFHYTKELKKTWTLNCPDLLTLCAHCRTELSVEQENTVWGVVENKTEYYIIDTISFILAWPFKASLRIKLILQFFPITTSTRNARHELHRRLISDASSQWQDHPTASSFVFIHTSVLFVPAWSHNNAHQTAMHTKHCC